MANSEWRKGNQGWDPHTHNRRTYKSCLQCTIFFYTTTGVPKSYCSVSCAQKSRFEKTPVWNKGKKLGDAGVTGGEHHWNWQGGKYIGSERPQRVRFTQYYQKKVLARDDYTCQVCQTRGGYLQVDHIKKWSEYPELRFDLDNCRTLCMACHYYITFKRKMPQGTVWGHNLRKVY